MVEGYTMACWTVKEWINIKNWYKLYIAIIKENCRNTEWKLWLIAEPDESLRGGYMLFFVDDGEGMDPSKLKNSVWGKNWCLNIVVDKI